MKKPDDEFNRRRRSGAIFTALACIAIVVLIYFITLARMQKGV